MVEKNPPEKRACMKVLFGVVFAALLVLACNPGVQIYYPGKGPTPGASGSPAATPLPALSVKPSA